MNNQTSELKENATAATLKTAGRAPAGMRSPAIRRFDLSACPMIVVSARRWAYRFNERREQEWRDEQAQA